MVFASYPHEEIEARQKDGKPGVAPGVFLRQVGAEHHAFNFDNLPCDLDGNVEKKELTLEQLAGEKAALAQKLKEIQEAEKLLKAAQPASQSESPAP